MYISHDYSYIKVNENKLIDAGYGKMTVHSLHFDRHYSEEQKEKNRQLAETMTKEEWNKHCDKIAESFDKPLKAILKAFTDRYNIHQVSEETSTLKHFKSDWDLYFWSNLGWNGKEYMDCFSLTFNDKRNAERNMKLLEEIVDLLKSLDYENIGCRIQYDAAIDENKVAEKCNDICENLLGKFIEYNGMIGKIKVVRKENDIKEYGFFKYNAKKCGYAISNVDIVAMNI